jgi:hypothetical protein
MLHYILNYGINKILYDEKLRNSFIRGCIIGTVILLVIVVMLILLNLVMFILDTLTVIVGSAMSILFFVVGFSIIYTILDYCGITRHTGKFTGKIYNNVLRVLEKFKEP